MKLYFSKNVPLDICIFIEINGCCGKREVGIGKKHI